MSTEHRGANGTLELYYDSYEAANDLRDTESSAKIFAQDDETIILEVYRLSSNVYGRPAIRESKERYSISVKDLIQLVSRNGTRLK